MKRTIFFLVVLFSVMCSIEAQWHIRSCGVIDINNCTTEEFNCLWEKANKTAQIGRTLTIIGIVSVGVGALSIPVAFSGGQIANFLGFASLAGVGVGIFGGIPTWIEGASRKSQLRDSPGYKALISGSLSVYPVIIKNHFNKTYSFGLTASLSF